MDSTQSSDEKGLVYCFGEVLWDCLPAGLFLGGAPCNVAYHLGRHGVRAGIVSAVGNDFLGGEIRRRVGGWGVKSDFLAISPNLPTGTVEVSLSAGVASYTIVEGVAWDTIPVTDELLNASDSATAIVYGTLALRGEANRASADRLLNATNGLKVLDINLRPPYTKSSVIDFALKHADFVKLNDDELFTLTGFTAKPAIYRDAIEACASTFARAHQLNRLCVTCGADGAGLLWGSKWYWEPGRPVEVRDTIGAGDAFLAALLAGLIADRPAADCLAAACRIGELIAGSVGATPDYTPPPLLA